MTRNEELAAVIRLACLTECRSDQEQRALISLAWRCDVEHNKLTTTNRALKQPGWEPQDLVSLVRASRVLEDGDREVPAPKGWEKRWESWTREMALLEGVYV